MEQTEEEGFNSVPNTLRGKCWADKSFHTVSIVHFGALFEGTLGGSKFSSLLALSYIIL